MKPSLIIRIMIVCVSFVLTGCSTGSAQMFDDASGPNVKSAPVFSSFAREQLRYPRVREARELTEDVLVAMFRERNISYPAAEVYVRVFKLERDLEVWVRPQDSKKFELLRTYPICAMAGGLGPKFFQGDGQVPEGFYNIDLFNPNSAYHLSMRLDYPNQRDRAVKMDKLPLGGDIFIHGGCKSAGCLAITDSGIRELYWLAVTAHGFGQQQIPVHIFPTRMDDAKDLRKVARLQQYNPKLIEFWQTLKPGYDFFQKKRLVPNMTVDGEKYALAVD
jgi:murein L,D-transpeptidase YafK